MSPIRRYVLRATNWEDHVYDEVCHIFMARPITPKIKPRRKSDSEKRIERLYKGKADDYERYSIYHQEETIRGLEIGGIERELDEYTEINELDDGLLVNTIPD